VICLNPKLGSDRLDDARFISTEDIDVDPPLCEPPDELLSSRPKPVNQTEYSNRFPFERDRKYRPGFPA